VNRFIREHIGRGSELDRPEFLKPAPEFYAFARPPPSGVVECTAP
jgi:hypothetical protein